MRVVANNLGSHLKIMKKSLFSFDSELHQEVDLSVSAHQEGRVVNQNLKETMINC